MRKVKLLISVLLTLVLVASTFMGITVSAEEPALPAVPLEGKGTEEEPFTISTADELLALAKFVNEGNAAGYDADAQAGGGGVAGNFYGYYFKQTADIDLSGVAWEPIGYSGGAYFAGNYDGGNFTISNAVSEGKQDADGYSTAGIFGWVAFGSVKNVRVENADFSATGNYAYSYVGGLAAVVYGATVTNCSVTDSVIESKRTPSNNNCAGGIVGYSTGGTFSECASVGNTVKAQAYGGGFVGEQDDGYGVGESTFTDCYVASCSVVVSSANAQDTNHAGGFVGEVTASTLTITNCYVYDTDIAIGAESVGSPQNVGVFAGYLWWGTYSEIADTNCYYSDCGTVTENVGNAVLKTEEEFADGTVAALLGDGYVAGDTYPIFSSLPADYSKVEEAIAKAEALDGTVYDKAAVDAAVAAVVEGKSIADQAEVDAMAQAIEDAIAEWKVNSGIAAANKSVEELAAELAKAKRELNSAIARKASKSDLNSAIDDLMSAYKRADTALKELLQAEIDADVAALDKTLKAEIDADVASLKADLEAKFADLKATLAAAVAELEARLDKEVADLNAAIEQGDKAAKDEIDKLSAELEKTKADADSASTLLIVFIIVIGVLTVANTALIIVLFTRKKASK